jgi:CHAT domain-containing protein
MQVELSAAHRRDDPAALQALALIGLVRKDPRGIALDSAVSLLRQAADLADSPAPYLADLSAALLVRAERNQAPRDILEANETAEHALQLDRRNPVALYNHALALDRFGLVDETIDAWRGYLAVDSTSGWAGEATRRIRLLRSIRPPPQPAANAPESAYAAYALADAQGARELGMDHLLGEWGAAVEAGDSATAADRLRRAAWLGDALLRRPGGDASLADLVRAIRATADTAQLRTLAQAHHEYADGRRTLDALDYNRARVHLTTAEELAPARSVLRAWTGVYLGTLLILRDAREEGLGILSRALAADAGVHPALAARVHWALARTIGSNEGWERALEDARESARLFARSGERENEGAVLDLLSDIRFVLGEPDSAYAAMHRSLDRLKPYRASLRLHNRLLTAARAVSEDGLLQSAIRIQGEGVGVAVRIGTPPISAEARLASTRLLAASGYLALARTQLDSARALVAQLADPVARGWFEADLRDSEGAVSIRSDPAAATRALDSTVTYFSGRRLPFRVLPALVASAEARLAAGDAPGALSRLERAVTLLERRRDSIRMEPRRAAVFNAAHNVLDRVVLLMLGEGRPAEALDYIDRGRASLAPSGLRSEGAPAHAGALPGEVALEYARVADTVLVWTVTPGRVKLARTVLDTIRFARTLEELEDRLQRRAPDAEVLPALSQLYEWLVRPVTPQLDPAASLRIVADGEIAAVPFAALFDARDGRYLMEDHEIRFAVSLRHPPQAPLPSGPARVVLLVDPAFDEREYPLLNRLQRAHDEAGAIATNYPGVTIFEGATATPAALRLAFARSTVVHFAGHAVFDDQRPERSYLVLAADTSGKGTMTAAELSRLDLQHVRLVVLSACRTVRSGRGRADGFSGLAGALLAAGAGGVVGSTWSADDASTSALMIRFHHAYSADADGPAALRAAQLSLLRSPITALRSPSAWAGFRFVGR